MKIQIMRPDTIFLFLLKKKYLKYSETSSSTATTTTNKDSSTTSTDITSSVTEYQREMKNNQTIPCMSNCGEWRVLEYPEFIHSNRHYNQNNNNFNEQQRRQFNTHNTNKNQTNSNQYPTNNSLRRHYDTQDNHFSSDDRYSNQINHQTIQFPYQSYNERYFFYCLIKIRPFPISFLPPVVVKLFDFMFNPQKDIS